MFHRLNFYLFIPPHMKLLKIRFAVGNVQFTDFTFLLSPGLPVPTPSLIRTYRTSSLYMRVLVSVCVCVGAIINHLHVIEMDQVKYAVDNEFIYRTFVFQSVSIWNKIIKNYVFCLTFMSLFVVLNNH